jgi:hypothetical protein
MLLSVFCLLIYYIYLRNWDLTHHQPSRMAFAWVFMAFGLTGLVYGCCKNCDPKPVVFLVISFVLLLITIGMTLSPGLVIFKKWGAKIARWRDRLRFQ